MVSALATTAENGIVIADKTSSSIKLNSGVTLDVASVSGVTTGELLSGIVTGEGRVKLTDTQTLTDGTTTTFGGILEIAGNGTDKAVQLYVGTGPSQSVNLSSISNIVLNNGAQLYLHADPKLDQDFKKISVETGKGFLYLRDSDGAPLHVGEMAVASSSNLTIWSNWFDSAVTVDALTGSGTFQVESSDDSAQNASVTVNSLVGFTGDINIIQDTARNLKVELSTGTVENGKSVSINSITVNDTHDGGKTDFDLNVQADTTIGTISVSGNGTNTINIAKEATLHSFTKTGNGTITLTGYGTYDFGDYDIGGGNNATSDTYNSAISVTYGTGWYGTVRFGSGSSFQFMNLDLEKFANGGNSTIELAGVTGYLQTSSSEKTYSADFKFTGDGFTINNGYGGSKYKFTGDFSGLGNLTLNKDLSNGLQFTFAGDMSEWTGELKHQLDPQNKYIYDAADDVLDTSIGNKLTAAGGANHNMEVTVKTNRDVVMNGELRATAGSTLNVTKENEGNLSVESVAVEKTGVVNVAGLRISATNSTADATMTQKADTQGALTRLHEDASFTIEDMTLTNTSITAAETTTRVNLSNVSVGADSLVTLAKGAFSVQDQANVAMGGSACNFTTSSYSGLVLGAAGEASITLNLGDLSQLNPMGPGVYDIAILLDGFQMTGDNASVLFAADSWLGQLLAQSNNAGVEISIRQAAAGEAATAGAGAATGVSYSTGNVGTIITINGLNVPEPTTSTLSLLALAGLCARRRRKM